MLLFSIRSILLYILLSTSMFADDNVREVSDKDVNSSINSKKSADEILNYAKKMNIFLKNNRKYLARCGYKVPPKIEDDISYNYICYQYADYLNSKFMEDFLKLNDNKQALKKLHEYSWGVVFKDKGDERYQEIHQDIYETLKSISSIMENVLYVKFTIDEITGTKYKPLEKNSLYNKALFTFSVNTGNTYSSDSDFVRHFKDTDTVTYFSYALMAHALIQNDSYYDKVVKEGYFNTSIKKVCKAKVDKQKKLNAIADGFQYLIEEELIQTPQFSNIDQSKACSNNSANWAFQYMLKDLNKQIETMTEKTHELYSNIPNAMYNDPIPDAVSKFLNLDPKDKYTSSELLYIYKTFYMTMKWAQIVDLGTGLLTVKSINDSMESFSKDFKKYIDSINRQYSKGIFLAQYYCKISKSDKFSYISSEKAYLPTTKLADEYFNYLSSTVKTIENSTICKKYNTVPIEIISYLLDSSSSSSQDNGNSSSSSSSQDNDSSSSSSSSQDNSSSSSSSSFSNLGYGVHMTFGKNFSCRDGGRYYYPMEITNNLTKNIEIVAISSFTEKQCMDNINTCDHYKNGYYTDFASWFKNADVKCEIDGKLIIKPGETCADKLFWTTYYLKDSTSEYYYFWYKEIDSNFLKAKKSEALTVYDEDNQICTNRIKPIVDDFYYVESQNDRMIYLTTYYNSNGSSNIDFINQYIRNSDNKSVSYDYDTHNNLNKGKITLRWKYKNYQNVFIKNGYYKIGTRVRNEDGVWSDVKWKEIYLKNVDESK